MFKIPKNFKLICQFIAGSHLYGNTTKNSDIDTRGVYIPSEEYFYGFMNVNRHLKSNEEDLEYHEIREFLKLALDNNPNIIEYLFVQENKLLTYTKEWKQVLENRKYFISKNANLHSVVMPVDNLTE